MSLILVLTKSNGIDISKVYLLAQSALAKSFLTAVCVNRFLVLA